MIDTHFLNQLNRFSLVVRKRITSNYAGERRSISAGSGMVFKDHRIYAPGDDFRAIDWKVYARTDDLHIKTYDEERNFNVHIIVDASKSMDYGKKNMTKFDFASMIGVGFAYLALKDNSKFRFSTFSEKIHIFESRKGMHQLSVMIDHLNSTKLKGSSRLLDSITQYKKMIGSRSLIVIVSDFLFDIEEIKTALLRLGRHEIKVIQVLDRIEKDLNISGDYKLQDSESGGILRTFVGMRLKSKYRNMMDAHTAKIKDLCNKMNIDFHQITTDTPLFDTFYEVLR